MDQIEDTPIARPYGGYAPQKYEVESLAWFDRKGDTRFSDEIAALEATRMEHIGEAGRYWMHCPFLAETLTKIDDAIKAVYRQCNSEWADGVRKAWGHDNT